jgi:hypothetical protein
MGYMSRVGLWGAGCSFASFGDFVQTFKRLDDIGSMELIATELKQQGAYIARSLSYESATFEVVETSLTSEQLAVYDEAVLLWKDMMLAFKDAAEETGKTGTCIIERIIYLSPSTLSALFIPSLNQATRN